MLEQVKSQFEKQNIQLEGQKFLLAASGGMDSMALLHMLIKLNANFEVAHVNYHLRGEDSNEDADLLRDYCNKHNIRIHIQDLDEDDETPQKGNLQANARQIRYGYFNQLMGDFNFDYLLTAHHQGDQLENILMNIFRGIGPKMIQSKFEKIFRPLIDISKKALRDYVQENDIPFREDLSNRTNKYDRNYVRNEILPLLRDRFHNLDNKVLSFAQRYWADQNIISEFYDDQLGEEILLQEMPSARALFHVIKHMGFSLSQAEEIMTNQNNNNFSISSKSQVLSIKDKILKVYPANSKVKEKEIAIQENDFPKVVKWRNSLALHFSFDKPAQTESNLLMLSYEKLKFPLIIRSWKDGDRITLAGMKGKSKKLKKLFNDYGITKHEKNDYPVLLDAQQKVISVIGLRTGEGYHLQNKVDKKVCIYWTKT